jgi:hypothetical protein
VQHRFSSVGLNRGLNRRAKRRSFLFEGLEARQVLAANLVISEFMAANGSTIEDDDGQDSDWIEMYNADAAAVNLSDWYLTDNSTRPTKWNFPDISIDPGEYLLVWATGNDRRDPAQPLHTNFALSASGEYLALVYDDPTVGLGAVQSFNFTQQQTDISVGFDQPVTTNTLVGSTAPASYLVPTPGNGDTLGTTWTAAGFNDAAWTAATGGIGYDEGGELSSLVNTNVETTVQGTNSSIFTRYEFGGIDPATVDDLRLTVNHDDGFVAYLNGTEVARRNAPAGTPAWNAAAAGQHGGIQANVNYANFASAASDFACVGHATVAGGACNVVSNRLRITPSLGNQAGAAWTSQGVPFGPDYTFSTRMDIDVHTPGGSSDVDGQGADGMVFVLQADGNNRLGAFGAGIGLDQGGLATYVGVEFDTWETGSFDPAGGLGTHIGINIDTPFDELPGRSIARTAVPRFNGPCSAANCNPMNSPAHGGARHVWIDYDGVTNQMRVYFTNLATKPATATLTATVDLEAIFQNTPFLYAGWTAGTGGAFNVHDVLNWEMTTDAKDLPPLVQETINISQNASVLSPTGNVLAIHGLNLDAADSDFLIRPQLHADQISPIVVDPLRWFINSTPGGPNSIGTNEPTRMPLFSHPAGTFVDPFSLTLAAEPGAAIRYTTNGTVPTASSTLYTGPITVSTTSRIRAIAIAPGKASSLVVGAHYIALDNTVANFDSNLPILILETYSASIPGTTSQSQATIAAVVIDTDAGGRASMTGSADYAGRAGLRVRGRTSAGFAKTPYALELRNEDESDNNVSLVGLPSDSDWALLNPHSEKSLLQNALTYQWAADAGEYAPRTRYVEVFRNQNGGKINYADDYMGVYLLSEKIKIDDNRVDIVQPDAGDNTGLDVTGGYIWKKDKIEEVGDFWWYTAAGVNGVGRAGPGLLPQQLLQFHDPDLSDVSSAQLGYLIDYVNSFVATLDSPEFTDPVNGYAKYIDIDSWINLWINVELTKNIDGYRLSAYFHKDRDRIDPVTLEVVPGKIIAGPIWDSNLSLGNANYLRGGHPTGWYADSNGNTEYPYYRRLYQDPNFRQKLTDRWQELRNTVFTTENLLADVDHFVDLLSDGNPLYEKPLPIQPTNPISRNFTKYNILGTYHWPNCYYVGNMGDCPTNAQGQPLYPTPTTYQDHLTILRDFITQRTAWMDSQFLGAPLYSQNGGIVEPGFQLTLTSPVTTSYTETTLIDEGTTASYFVPTDNTLGTTWTATNFTPNPAWATGPMGFGYETAPADYADLIETPVNPGTACGTCTAILARIPFTVTGTTGWDSLRLRAKYDDGFVAYLNGVEVARRNAPAGAPGFNSAGADHPDTAAVVFEDVALPASALSSLVIGENVLAVHALNSGTGSSDMLISVALVARDDGTPSSAPTYYTTDGTDPRGPNGNPSASAQLYAGPITITENTEVIARTFQPGTPISTMATQWSGATDHTFVTTTTPLVITEVNYNPTEPSQAEINAGAGEAADFEFLELKNVGLQPLALGGYQLTDGVDFVFPNMTLAPGDHVLVVRNEPAFHLRYGNGQNIAGEFGGSLANEGEHVTLLTHINELVLDFDYDDDWYGLTDGDGWSLTIVNPLADHSAWGQKESWRPSDYALGSPDIDDAGLAPPQDSLKLNEIVTNSTTTADRIEIRNTTAAALSIDGFRLTYSRPDPADPLMTLTSEYTLPASTPSVPVGGYLVLNAETSFGSAFDLSPNGGTLTLHAADGSGALIGFRTDDGFGAADPNTSHGRYIKSDGSTDFVQQLATTLGAANSAPFISPVVINEVMYHPAPGNDEYVELYNRTGAAADLTGWSLKSGAALVYYTFPSLSLGPGQHLIISSTDPAAFRAKYSIPAGVQIVGPFVGVLEDSDPNGESVELHRPPIAPGTASVRTDRVRYFSTAPWPVAANGRGPSLARLDASAYGNDVINWTSGIPGGTPGAANLFFDATGPSQPGTPLPSVMPDQSVALDWTPSADPDTGVLRYHIIRNGATIGTSATPEFIDATAALNTAYSYLVIAENRDGVISQLSNSTPLKIFTISNVTRADANHFRVAFSEGVTAASAQNLANYNVTNATLVSAVLEANGTSVLLETAAPIVDGSGYRIVANNIVANAAATGSVLLPDAQRTIIPGVASALLGEYYDSVASPFATPPASAPDVGPKVGERFDGLIQFTWITPPGISATSTPFIPNPTLPSTTNDTIGVRWTGRLVAPVTGSYTFSFLISTTAGGDGVRLWIDADEDGELEDIPSEQLVNAWPATASPQSGTVSLVAGHVYNVRIDFYENTSTAQINFRWQHPAQATLVTVPSANLQTPTVTESERPNVTSVKLGSSGWTPAFLSQLQAAGFGTGGINVPLGGSTPLLPWANLNQVSMTFDEDVNVGQDGLLVNGVNAAAYGIAGFDYDYATYTATWTLAQPLPNDRVTVALAGSAADLVGNSVEGATGGTLLALPGDVNQSGAVDPADFRANLDRQFSGIGSPSYSVLHDTDGNGAINIQDWQNVRLALGETLPPSPSPASAPAAVVVTGARGATAGSSNRAARPATLRTSGGPRLSQPAIDEIISTPAESPARTLRASRGSRPSAAVNPAALDDLFTIP